MKRFECPMSTHQAHTYASIIVETANAKGFDGANWDNFVGKVAISMTELDEAHDGAIGTYGEWNLDEELSDIVIRLLDVLHRLGEDRWCIRSGGEVEEHAFCSAPELLWPVFQQHAKSIEAWRHGRRKDALIHLEFAVKECFKVADRCKLDLIASIEAKMEKNTLRPARNGKVESLG